MRKLVIAISLLLPLLIVPYGVKALPKEGERAPNFMVPTYDNESISIMRLEGKVIMLIFAAEWCPHCGEEVPAISKAWKEAGLTRSDVIGVLMMVASKRDKAIKFYERANPPDNWKLVLDANTVAEKYGVSGVPTTIIIDKNGTVADIFVGAVPPEKIIGKITELLGIGAGPAGNYTTSKQVTCNTETEIETKTQTTPKGEESLSLGAIILIALGVVIIVAFGLWYYRTMKKLKVRKKSKSKKK